MFQPQVLKIDEGIVLVAKRLGITVVAEGIETLEERDALLDLDVDLMQGYLFARPAIGQLQSMPTELIQPSRI